MAAREIEAGKYSRGCSTKERVRTSMVKLSETAGADIHYVIIQRESDGQYIPVITNAIPTGLVQLANDNYMIVG